MTKSSRTSIRLTNNLWDFIDNSIGVIGYNRSSVIGAIILSYFKNEKNRNELKSMKKDYTEIIENLKKEKARESENFHEKLKNFLEVSDRIPLETFIEHLNIDSRFFHDNLYNWAKKYNFIFENNIIIKIPPES